MAIRGAKPKPTERKILEGTWRKDRANGAEPLPSAGERPPVPPKWIKGYARSTWNRMAKELHRLKLLTRVDRDALAAYCCAVEDLRAAREAIAIHGRFYTTDKGNVVQHPAVGQANTAMERIRQYSTEFGLTPSARVRVRGEKADTESAEEKAAAELLGTG